MFSGRVTTGCMSHLAIKEGCDWKQGASEWVVLFTLLGKAQELDRVFDDSLKLLSSKG